VQAPSSAQPVNNDGLTKQQLDLIHQIMQQTQQQAAAHQKQHQQQNSNSSTKNSVASNSTTSSVKAVSSTNKCRTWTVQVGRPLDAVFLNTRAAAKPNNWN
jgi:DNA-binding protein H-NS